MGSRAKAVEVVRYQPEALVSALDEINHCAISANDSVVASEAQSLAKDIKSYHFFLCSAIWYDILNTINLTNNLLQTENYDISQAIECLNRNIRYFHDYRKAGFISAQITANELAQQLHIPPQLETKRVRRRKRMFDYETEDECIEDGLCDFGVSFFNKVVDSVIVSLEERFKGLKEFNNGFGFLTDILSSAQLTDIDLQNHCTRLQKILTIQNEDGMENDICGQELVNEIKSVGKVLSQKMTPMEVIRLLHNLQIAEYYPNLHIALKIFLTMPVTVASCERSFSTLKLIKTYLRSTMMQERLSGLAIISINHEIATKIDYSTIIDNFAAKKARKTVFN